MSDETWPAPTSRDEMLRRVVTRGRRIQMINRLIVAAIAGGAVAAGAIGVVLGTNGTVELFGAGTSATVAPPSGGQPFYACPNDDEVGRFRGGDRVYVTGRDGSGEWIEVRSPVVPDARVWVPAAAVDPDADVDLPERSCEVTELALEGPGVVTTTTVPEEEPPEEESPEEEPETTTTARPGTTPPTQPGPAPTTPTTQPSGPTPPPPTPTTAPPVTTTPPPPVDTTGPTITQLARTTSDISDGDTEFCLYPMTSEVSASVSDSSGLQSVTMRWSFVAGGQVRSGSTPMVLSGGRYVATLGPFAGVMSNGEAAKSTNWSVRAVDVHGNARVVASGSNSDVTIHFC